TVPTCRLPTMMAPPSRRRIVVSPWVRRMSRDCNTDELQQARAATNDTRAIIASNLKLAIAAIVAQAGSARAALAVQPGLLLDARGSDAPRRIAGLDPLEHVLGCLVDRQHRLETVQLGGRHVALLGERGVVGP